MAMGRKPAVDLDMRLGMQRPSKAVTVKPVYKHRTPGGGGPSRPRPRVKPVYKHHTHAITASKGV